MQRKIDWRSGSGMAIACYAVMLIIVYMMIWVLEPSGWYWKIAISQTRTDAICEGAAAVGDTGYIDARGTNKNGEPKNKTEIDAKAIAEKARKLSNENEKRIKGKVNNFRFIDNTGGNTYYTGTPKISYDQRIYAVATAFDSDNIFRATQNNQYTMSSNSFTYIIGVEKALRDTTRFSEMYSDDATLPVAPLTNVSGDKMQGVFEGTENDSGSISKSDVLIEDLNDNYSAALYNAVLNQFNVEAGEHNGSERYKALQSVSSVYCEDYVYDKSDDHGIQLPVSDTLLWDISVAMGKELPRYKDVNKPLGDNKASYYDWEKGRKGVQLTTIDITGEDSHLFKKATGVGEAARKANEGKITFTIKNNVYYFVRPTRTDSIDGTGGAYQFDGQKKLPCLYSNGMDFCSNNSLITFGDSDVFYYID